MAWPSSFSLVLPCFNEEENITNTVRAAAEWFSRSGLKGEIVVVNDGSRDASAAVLQGLQAEIPLLRVVTHETNAGYGASIRSGCDVATGAVIGFMDSDGQFHVEDFEKLFALYPQFRFVTGIRVNRADRPLRILNATMYAWLLRRALTLRVKDINCGMKLFTGEIWPVIRPKQATGALFNAEVYLRLKHAGIPWGETPVGHYPRLHGTPTGAKFSVILRMFLELRKLRSDVLAGR